MSPGARRSKDRSKSTAAREPASPVVDRSRVETLETLLAQALDRETATREILASISQTSDLEGVFEAIAKRARRLCGGAHAGVFLFDGRLVHIGGIDGVETAALEAFRRTYPLLPTDASATTRAILRGEIVEVPDVL